MKNLKMFTIIGVVFLAAVNGLEFTDCGKMYFVYFVHKYDILIIVGFLFALKICSPNGYPAIK